METEAAAGEEMVQAKQGVGVAQAALTQSTQAIVQAQGTGKVINNLRPVVRRAAKAKADQWKAMRI